jgi:hypothetical protein
MVRHREQRLTRRRSRRHLDERHYDPDVLERSGSLSINAINNGQGGEGEANSPAARNDDDWKNVITLLAADTTATRKLGQPVL